MNQIFIFFISGLAILLIAGGFIFSNFNRNAKLIDLKDIDTPKDSVKSISKRFSKEELGKKLQELSKTSVPDELNIGAMCYEVAEPPKRAEYICPVCGHKTIYNELEARYVVNDISVARLAGESLKKYDIQIVENNYCSHCRKNKTDARSLSMIINYLSENKPRKIDNVSVLDIQIINEFLNGQVTHSDGNGNLTPLNNYIDRIEFLLDIKK